MPAKFYDVDYDVETKAVHEFGYAVELDFDRGARLLNIETHEDYVQLTLPDARKLRDYLNENLPDAPSDEEIIDQARVLVAADDHTFVDDDDVKLEPGEDGGYYVSAKVYVPADALKKGAR